MARLRELCRVGRKLPFDISSVSADAVLDKLCFFLPYVDLSLTST